MRINNYKIHPLAKMVPMISKSGLEALTMDIGKNKQKEPALLWKNAIVDGRGRQEACNKLGIPLQVEYLPDDMTYEEVRSLVKSTQIRRNILPTQLAMTALNEYLENEEARKEDQTLPKISLETVAKSWGVSKDAVKTAKKIYELAPQLKEDLFDGNSVCLYDNKAEKDITTNKLNTIKRILTQQTQEEEQCTQEALDKFHMETTVSLHEHKETIIDYNDYLPIDTVREYFWQTYKNTFDVPILKRDIAISLTTMAENEITINELRKELMK
jgi:hypothetical protein